MTHPFAARLCMLLVGTALSACGSVTSDRTTSSPTDAGSGTNNPSPTSESCGSGGKKVFQAAQLFTFRAPCDWTGGPEQGIDSYVGKYTASGLEAFYDYGGYSSPLTEFESYPGYTKQPTTIAGRAAYFVTAEDPEAPGGRRFIAAVHVPAVDSKGARLTMHGTADSAAKQQLLLDVYATIEVVPP